MSLYNISNNSSQYLINTKGVLKMATLKFNRSRHGKCETAPNRYFSQFSPGSTDITKSIQDEMIWLSRSREDFNRMLSLKRLKRDHMSENYTLRTISIR